MGLVIIQNSEKRRKKSCPRLCRTEHWLNIILLSFLKQSIETPFTSGKLGIENDNQPQVLQWAWNQNSKCRISGPWLFHSLASPIKSHINWPKSSTSKLHQMTFFKLLPGVLKAEAVEKSKLLCYSGHNSGTVSLNRRKFPQENNMRRSAFEHQ